jgi:phenylacetate-CoA ligase
MIPNDKIYKNIKFKKRLGFLKKSQTWSKKKIENYQLLKIREIFRHVKNNVPFYIDYFKNKNIKESDIKSLNDIKIFPIVTKKIIQKRSKEFLIKNFKKNIFFNRTTGGSTGTPLTIWSDLDHQIKDKANTKHYLKIFDLDLNKFNSVRIYGDKIGDKLVKKKIFWKKKNKTLVMSAYHLNHKNIDYYLQAIKKFKPIYIHSRASIIFTFAKLLYDLKIKINLNLKYIFVDGECLNLGQRKLIQSAFNTRMINIYGHTEGALVGHPCKFSNFLHFMPQNGLIELLSNKNQKINKIGTKGNIIATGFNNKIMPLIRYKTGDIGVNGPNKCRCHRNYKILKEIEGREQDYVIDKNGNPVPLAPAIFNYNDMDWKNIEEFKILQSKKGKLKVLLQISRSKKQLAKKVLINTKNRLSKIFGNHFSLSVKKTDYLKKTSIGKYRYLDQKLRVNI